MSTGIVNELAELVVKKVEELRSAYHHMQEDIERLRRSLET